MCTFDIYFPKLNCSYIFVKWKWRWRSVRIIKNRNALVHHQNTRKYTLSSSTVLGSAHFISIITEQPIMHMVCVIIKLMLFNNLCCHCWCCWYFCHATASSLIKMLLCVDIAHFRSLSLLTHTKPDFQQSKKYRTEILYSTYTYPSHQCNAMQCKAIQLCTARFSKCHTIAT